jgi:hypothetical protein
VCQERYKAHSCVETQSVEKTETSQGGVEKVGVEENIVEEEAANSTKRWFSRCPFTTPDWFSCIKIIRLTMEHAKKMVLVDERLFNSLQTKAWEKPMTSLIKKIDSGHQLSWKRPLDQRVKSDLSKQMQAILNDTIDDNVKSKLYNQTLTRFHHTGSKLSSDEEEEEPINVPAPVKKKKTKKKKKTPITPSSIKTRSRKRKIPRFDWVEY